MNNLIQGFLDNDSFFGRFMTKLGIIIAANIMFVLLSIPFFTIGAGFSALYYVMFRTLRGDGVVNPFKEFWAGLKANFKQATISWIIFVLLIAFLLTDIRICKAAGGALDLVKIGVYALGAAAVIIYLYLIPVMTVFRDTLPHLIRNAVYFLIKKPWKTVVILFFDIFPAPYLASKEEEAGEEAAEPESHMRTEEEILEDMRKLDGL